MRTLLALSVGALCLCVSITANVKSDHNGDQPFPEEDGILKLRKEHFKKALETYKQLLVHFYSPFTREAHHVSAAFKEAAGKLQESEVKLAVVDVMDEKDLVKELNATSDPAVRLYLAGDMHSPVSCPDPQSSSAILTWLKRRAGSAADYVVDSIGSSEDVKVVGFFKDVIHPYVRVFYAASVDLPDVSFALTQKDEVVSKYQVTHDVVLLFKNSQLQEVYKMTPQTTKEELILFISIYKMDPVTEYNGQTASQILSSPVLNHALLFVNKSSENAGEISAGFTKAAQSFRMKIVFVLVNVDEPRNGRLMEYFRVRGFEAPLIRLVNLTDHVTYQLPSETLTAEIIMEFCQSYLNGKAKPKMQSEPIPEDWDNKPVKELVGMNLEKVAFNPDRTVFVLLYLPYNPASRALFPLWEGLAEAFKEQEDVVIARIDASANDINMSMHGAYPALCLFPALHAERVVCYKGTRKLKDLIRFVEKEKEKAKKDRVKEDEEREKYSKSLKEENAKKNKKTKQEL